MDQHSGTVTVRHGLLPREKRREIFGLDCIDQLEWRNWQPGTEYVKHVVLKNVSTNTLKLKYKQTASKAFSMDFPEPFKLRPGMSHSLKVVFRPLRMQQYSDHIEVFCNNGSFILMVEAFMPSTHIEVPSRLDFGFVATKECATRPLTVRNTGDVKVHVAWKLDAPFSVEPSTSVMAPSEVATFHVSFQPEEACSFDANAACCIDSAAAAYVKVTGIGKFPYLSMENQSVDFGNVLVGKSVEHTIRFGNHSIVDAHFSFVHSEGVEDGVFAVAPNRGTLGPDEFSILRVVYTPKHTGTFSSEHFVLSTPGGNKVSLNLRGNAIGPCVTFSTRSFNFGSVQANQTTSRVLYIQNHSEVPVSYEFQLDPLGTFTISKPRAVIPPNSTAHTTVCFRSATPANYWQRVACLIKDADPLGLDLIATCFDDLSRPPPLAARHIEAYMLRVTSGGAPVTCDPATISIPPSPVGSYHGEDLSDGASSFPAEEERGLLRSGGLGDMGVAHGSAVLVGPDGWDLFFQGQDPASAISVDTSLLDFGTCSRLSAAEYKSVAVTNKTSAKVTAFFQVPSWQDPVGGQPQPIFQVFPEVADIKPSSQVTFRVGFRPPKDAQHHSHVLQLCAYVKSMRNFRLVPDAHVVPPWCLPVLAVGNTFLHTNPECAPKVELTHSKVTFPPSRLGERACQTAMLLNHGDTPVSFKFHGTALGKQFAIRPEQGVVPPKGQVLLGLRFSPSDTRPVAAKVRCVLNGVAMSALELMLQGAGHMPRLAFDVNGTLFFRPTCVGASSQRALTIHNPSRIPVAFQWQLPPKLEGVVSLSPLAGLLRGNESMHIMLTFQPSLQRTYDARLACMLLKPEDYNPMLLPGPVAAANSLDMETVSGPPAGSEKLYLHIVGEGTQGALALDPPSLELGAVKVGHAIRRTVNLINQSDGVLRYSLECGADESADGLPEPDATAVEFSSHALVGSETRNDCELWVDEAEGAIPARASKPVVITFYPRFRKEYRLQLRCRTSTIAPIAAPVSGLRPPSNPSSSRLAPQRSLGKKDAITPDPAAPAGAVAGAGVAVAPGLVLLPDSYGMPATANPEAKDKWPAAVVCSVTASSTFPTVRITGAFCNGVPKQVLWGMMEIQALNLELASHVTQMELELNKMEAKGVLTTEVCMRALEPCTLDFGLQPVGDQLVEVHLDLTNCTQLPVSWVLHSYDDPDVELENWVEPGQPRNKEEQARDFIAEHKVFDIRPRHGQLEPGACSTVTFAYKPKSEGTHDFPIFLHIEDGKRLRLQLHGQAVASPVQRLNILPSYRTFTFAAGPIGELHPPLQTYLLRNGGTGEISYSIDLGPLQQLAAHHWGFEVIKLSSPLSGVIAPGGVAPLNWIFTPLEAMYYSADLPITLGDGTMELVALQGRGYHPDAPNEPAALPSEGERDWALWTGFSAKPTSVGGKQLAAMSHDMLSLGTTLIKGVTRRLLVVTNTSQYTTKWSWDLGLFGAAEAIHGRLQITPSSGHLEPGECVMCKVVLEAGLVPQLFEAEIHCNIRVDEDAMSDLATATQNAELAAVAAANMEYTDSGSVIEETIEEHCHCRHAKHPKHPNHLRSSHLKGRLPVHMCMTTAIRNRIEALDMQYTNTLQALSQQVQDALRWPQWPEPQILKVTLTGRILTELQVKAGSYIPGHELEAAQQLLQGASWVPPTLASFWQQQQQQRQQQAEQQQAEQQQAEQQPLLQLTNTGTPTGAPAVDSASSVVHELPLEQQQSRRSSSTPQYVADEAYAASTSIESAGRPLDYDAACAPEPQDVSDIPEEAAMQVQRIDGIAACVGEIGAETIAGKEEIGEGSTCEELESADVLMQLKQQHQQHQEDTDIHKMSAEPAKPAEAAEAAHDALLDGTAGTMEHVEGMSFNLSWKPLPKPASMRVPEPAVPSVQEESAQAVAAVLQDLLVDMLDPFAQPHVFATWDTLFPEHIPAFAELRSELPGAYKAAQPTQPLPHQQEQLAAEISTTSDHTSVGVDSIVQGAQASSGSTSGLDMLPARSSHSSSQAGQQQQQQQQQLDKVLQDPSFQVFAEFVLESAVLGLMQESAAGGWEPPSTA